MIVGVLMALIPANVWLMLVTTLGVPVAACAEAAFLAVFVWWAHGGGPPRTLRDRRRTLFRGLPRGAAVWTWSLVAAVSFAATVHAAIALLFRLVPFPAAAFHQGYDLSFIPTRGLQWIAVVVSAASAGICEEIGFRGYMQQPLEGVFGWRPAVVVSSLLFTLAHLTKSWALIGIVPIVFSAGGLLGMLAWAAGSIVPCMIGHTIMDVGLFGFWWTGLAGTFAARPISETGLDRPFLAGCVTLALCLSIVLFAIRQTRRGAEASMVVPTPGVSQSRR